MSGQSLLPQNIPSFTEPLGTVNKETGQITISKSWYAFLNQLSQYSLAQKISTADAVIMASAEDDVQKPITYRGMTGAQTATFTASNKPGTGTTTPSKWITVYVDGQLMFIPVWL